MESKYKVGQTVIYHTDYDNKEYEFTIKRIEHQQVEDSDLESIIYYDCEKGESGTLLYEEDIDGLSPNHINITRENLKENGWIFDTFEYEKFDGKLESWDKQFTVDNKIFNCTLRNDSNTIGRDWFVHIDNQDFEGVASLDVATYGQIDRLLKLLTE